MKINLEFVELCAPLFLAGKNCSTKIMANEKTGFTLVYDRTEKEVLITYNGKTGIVPFARCEHVTPIQDAAVLKPEASVPQQQVGKTGKFNANPSAKAQVGSPTSHVFGE